MSERISDERLRQIAETSYCLEEEKRAMARELIYFRRRYAFRENQRLCLGYGGGCDGELVNTEHYEGCPARAADLKLRPHLYVAQHPCEYCGPVCYGGAEHSERVENEDRAAQHPEAQEEKP